jgi:hypothetical protein
MWVQYDADRRVLLPRWVVAALDAASRSREDDLGHFANLDRCEAA